MAQDLGSCCYNVPKALLGMETHSMYDKGIHYTILLFTKTPFGDEDEDNE